jgi:hypothetical protein
MCKCSWVLIQYNSRTKKMQNSKWETTLTICSVLPNKNIYIKVKLMIVVFSNHFHVQIKSFFFIFPQCGLIIKVSMET